MKTNFKFILPLILISAFLILLTGCMTTPTDESPGVTGTGTIIGTIAAPCCSTSIAPVSDYPEYWCFYCQQGWMLQDGIEVVLTYGEDEVATTYTNEDGEYTFTDVLPGSNYVVTAYCPDYNDRRPLVKDVALEVASTFDTEITDLVSTSLGLVVDFLVLYTEWGPEDISLDAVILDQTAFSNFPKFKALIYEVRRVIENCEINLATDEEVLYATCRAAEEISGLDIGCDAGYAPPGPPPPEPQPGKYTLYLKADPWDGALSLTGAGVYVEETQNVVVDTEANSCYNFLYWTVDVGESSWVTVDLNTEPLEVDMNGNVTLTAHFACPPVDPDLVIDIGEISKAKTLNTSGVRSTVPPDESICYPSCAIINSVTVISECTEGDFPLELVPPYDPLVLNIVDHDSTGEIGIDYETGEICFNGDIGVLPKIYTIDVTYTNPCGVVAATGTVTVEFKDCSCVVPTADAGKDQSEEVCPGTDALIDLVGAGTGTGISYAWDFNVSDGITEDSTEQNPKNVVFGEGTYTVTLTVTGDCGSAIDTTTVTVNRAPVADLSMEANYHCCQNELFWYADCGSAYGCECLERCVCEWTRWHERDWVTVNVKVSGDELDNAKIVLNYDASKLKLWDPDSSEAEGGQGQIDPNPALVVISGNFDSFSDASGKLTINNVDCTGSGTRTVLSIIFMKTGDFSWNNNDWSGTTSISFADADMILESSSGGLICLDGTGVVITADGSVINECPYWCNE